MAACSAQNEELLWYPSVWQQDPEWLLSIVIIQITHGKRRKPTWGCPGLGIMNSLCPHCSCGTAYPGEDKVVCSMTHSSASQALNYLLKTLKSSGCHICQLGSCWPKQTPQSKVLLPELVVSLITTMALSGQTGQATIKQWHWSPALHQRMDWSSDNKETPILATKLSIITQWVVPLRFMQCWLPFCCTSQIFLCTFSVKRV